MNIIPRAVRTHVFVADPPALTLQVQQLPSPKGSLYTTDARDCELTRSYRTRSAAAPADQSDHDELLRNLDGRLSAVEDTLRRLPTAQSSHQGPSQQPRLAIREGVRSPQNADQHHSSPAESVLSIEEQTKRASQASELAAIDASRAPNVTGELAALRSILRDREGPTDVRCQPSARRQEDRGSQVELPPSEFVIRLLRTFATRQPILTLYHPVDDISQVEELCKRIYFPFETLTAGEITLFNGFIMVLLRDMISQPQDGLTNEEAEKYYALCRANFEEGVRSYEVMLTPSYEHILALSIATVNVQLEGDEILYARMVSAAAQHCLVLGYHREHKLTRLPPKEAERARHLFWQVYIFDKNRSLRLGTAPVIQDFDIDTKRPVPSETRGLRPWEETTTYMIELSSLQARIYQLLYSPSANNLEPHERQDIVSQLAPKLTKWYDGWCQIDASEASRKEVFDITFLPVNVIYYSVLTLVHRGATASNSALDITQACFEAARSGLQAHLACYQEFVSAGTMAISFYSSWILLFSSFTPYIITFSHCIGYSDHSDLELLKTVLDTLAHIGSVSQFAGKQYDLFKALHRIAEAYTKDCASVSEHGGDISSYANLLAFQDSIPNNWDFLDPSWLPNM